MAPSCRRPFAYAVLLSSLSPSTAPFPNLTDFLNLSYNVRHRGQLLLTAQTKSGLPVICVHNALLSLLSPITVRVAYLLELLLDDCCPSLLVCGDHEGMSCVSFSSIGFPQLSAQFLVHSRQSVNGYSMNGYSVFIPFGATTGS